jgi:uncharacterized YigZ family protein
VGDEVRRPAGPVTVEIDPIRGSRFIGDAGPAGDEDAAAAFVERVRRREPGATHHCVAWRIAEGRSRANDDGEPGGTAGRPMLQRIESAGLEQVVVVVSRYYGGTKLGTGGLIRAYGAAARAALDAVPVEVAVATVPMLLEHGFEQSSAVATVLAAFEVAVLAADYGLSVHLRLAVPRAAVDRFTEAIGQATAGRVVARRDDEVG